MKGEWEDLICMVRARRKEYRSLCKESRTVSSESQPGFDCERSLSPDTTFRLPGSETLMGPLASKEHLDVDCVGCTGNLGCKWVPRCLAKSHHTDF